MSNLHPITEYIVSELRDVDGQLSLPEDGLRRIESHIDGMASDPGLVGAVRSMLALAAHLELDRGAPGPAHALMHLVATRTTGDSQGSCRLFLLLLRLQRTPPG